MKSSGYRDSGADIAYCLWTHGADAATPVSNPDLYTEYGFIPSISDTVPGIRATLAAGAAVRALHAVIHLPTLSKPAICFSVLKFMAIR